MASISLSVHPEYLHFESEWEKYRYVAEGGTDFLEEYLQKFTDREDKDAFVRRKSLTPIPAFATAAVQDIMKAIFQRMTDISREGGTSTYQAAIAGDLGGVDLRGSMMNTFIGRQVLPELLNMGKVGMYVDMPGIETNANLLDTANLHPYYYIYTVENIRNWVIRQQGEFVEFESLLLRDVLVTLDDYDLPNNETYRYRYYHQVEDHVEVTFYDDKGDQVDRNDESTTIPLILDLPKIPFVLFQLNQSLLTNIANHQIALLNMESSDVMYALLSNFPFYTEQFDVRTQSEYLKGPTDGDKGKEIEVGGTQGRRYPMGSERPGFIHPSPEPLRASMEKQTAIKDDIRELVNLALSNISPRFASAASKEIDERGLEAGLSFIGLILEHGERSAADLWSLYEHTNVRPTIVYPDRYSLKSDKDRIAEAKELQLQMQAVPSRTFQKEMAKRMADILLGAKVSNETLALINKEIDASQFVTSSPEAIQIDINAGLVSPALASIARGYPEGEAEKAQEALSERMAMISLAQSKNSPGARGVVPDPQAAEDEKTDSQSVDKNPQAPTKRVRGKAQ